MLIKIFSKKSFRQKKSEEFRLGFEKKVSCQSSGGANSNGRKTYGAKSAVDYLLGKNRDRKDAKLLRGNPELSIKIAEVASRNFKNAYTVGCLAIEEKSLRTNQKNEIMDSFEELVFAGISSENRNILWVEHKDKRNLELNFFIPNIELSTNKRLQPYFHKADKTLFKDWRTMINQKYDLSNPDNPNKKQNKPLNKNLPKGVREIANQVHEYISMAVERGEIKNREQVIHCINTDFQEYGIQVARISKQSISITNPDGKRNIRLKGTYYEQEFGREIAREESGGDRYYGKNQEYRQEFSDIDGNGRKEDFFSRINARDDSSVRERLYELYKKRCERHIQQYKQSGEQPLSKHQFVFTKESKRELYEHPRGSTTGNGVAKGASSTVSNQKNINVIVVEHVNDSILQRDSVIVHCSNGFNQQSIENIKTTERANLSSGAEFKDIGESSSGENNTREWGNLSSSSTGYEQDISCNIEKRQGKSECTGTEIERLELDTRTITEKDPQKNDSVVVEGRDVGDDEKEIEWVM